MKEFFFFFFLSLFIKFEAESRPPSSLQMHGNAAILSRPSSFLQLFPLPFLSFPPFSNLPVFFFFFLFFTTGGKKFFDETKYIFLETYFESVSKLQRFSQRFSKDLTLEQKFPFEGNDQREDV